MLQHGERLSIGQHFSTCSWDVTILASLECSFTGTRVVHVDLQPLNHRDKCLLFPDSLPNGPNWQRLGCSVRAETAPENNGRGMSVGWSGCSRDLLSTLDFTWFMWGRLLGWTYRLLRECKEEMWWCSCDDDGLLICLLCCISRWMLESHIVPHFSTKGMQIQEKRHAVFG